MKSHACGTCHDDVQEKLDGCPTSSPTSDRRNRCDQLVPNTFILLRRQLIRATRMLRDPLLQPLSAKHCFQLCSTPVFCLREQGPTVARKLPLGTPLSVDWTPRTNHPRQRTTSCWGSVLAELLPKLCVDQTEKEGHQRLTVLPDGSCVPCPHHLSTSTPKEKSRSHARTGAASCHLSRPSSMALRNMVSHALIPSIEVMVLSGSNVVSACSVWAIILLVSLQITSPTTTTRTPAPSLRLLVWRASYSTPSTCLGAAVSAAGTCAWHESEMQEISSMLCKYMRVMLRGRAKTVENGRVRQWSNQRSTSTGGLRLFLWRWREKSWMAAGDASRRHESCATARCDFLTILGERGS